MTITEEIHRPELYWEYDSSHPSQRKYKITTNCMAGCMWINATEMIEETFISLAAHWIAALKGWPVESVKPVVVE
jgi:hypothetical protein